MKHTPGPWTFGADPEYDECFSVWWDHGGTGAEIAGRIGEAANARLIAAAPALLASLSELLYLARIGAQETGEGAAEIGRAAKLLNDLGEKP